MSKVRALIGVTIAGTIESVHHSELIEELVTILKEEGIESNFVDNVLTWGCLNQDWLEFKTEIETSWGWCEILCLKGKKTKDYDDFWKEAIFPALHCGRLLMVVNYINEDGSLSPHH